MSVPTVLLPRSSRAAAAAAAAMLSMALIAASCSSDTNSNVADTTVSTVSTTAPPDETSTEPTDDPATAPDVDPLSGLDGAIGVASDLVLSWFNGAPFTEATYEASFHATFREAISFDDLTPLLEQLRLDAPYSVQEVQGSTTTEAALIIVGSSAEPAVLSVAVASADDPTMTGLFIGPAEQPTFDQPATPQDAIDRLETMGALRFGAFDRSCATLDPSQPVPSTAVDTQAPIGSGFKLWVLAAVVDAVGSGTVAWDDEVTIVDALDSIPSGTTQNDPDGSVLTVRELAERMIEVSDNTATDHLMDLVGREAVEQAMIETGHGEPALNIPMMNTRDFTIVKFSNGELRARYIDADATERRRILDEEVAAMELPPLTNITTVVDPIDVETLEWFASPVDLCLALTELADDDEARAVLARNPGMPDTTSLWDAVLYKGGSEPGVFTMAWLVIDSDGTQTVVAGSLSNEDELIDEFEVANLFAFLRDSAPRG